MTKFHCLIASLLEILGNMCIAIVCFPDCHVIIKPFFYMNKKSGQKFKYLESEKSFKVK